MDENNLKQLWLNSTNEQKVEIDTEKLIESINQKIMNMEKLIKRRDSLEIFIAVCIVPVFGWFLITAPKLLTKTGAAVIILGCVLVIFKLIHARRINVKDDAASPVRYQLLVSLERVNQQIKLLHTVLWWYLLPFFIGVICFYYSSLNSALNKAVYTALVIVVYSYIYYLNKKAVKKHLIPLRDNLTRALDELLVS